MSPIVHIVNVGPAQTESLANVTVWIIQLNSDISSCHSFKIKGRNYGKLYKRIKWDTACICSSQCKKCDCKWLLLLEYWNFLFLGNSMPDIWKAHFFLQEIHDGFDFSTEDDGGDSFSIFSVKFSTDGRELVAGTSYNSIHVYDLNANRVSLRIQAHTVH